MERTGIAVAGTILVDEINEIKAYPACGELTQIQKTSRSTGGCVPNVAVDLKKLRPDMDILAVGKVGDDDNGRYAKEMMAQTGIDVSRVVSMTGEKTSFSQVMSIIGGQRTFFVYAGASAQFGAEDVALDDLQTRILHLGYFLLLDKIDHGDGLVLLKNAQQAGLKTSIDLVSENTDRYQLVLPCLPYVDYLIINEHEAEKLTDIPATNENLPRIAQALMDAGVKEKVIIHKPDRAICCSADGMTTVGSYVLPDGYIQGTTGAGDAFCSGALIGIHEGWSDREILEFASAAAVAALGAADATSGLKTVEQVREQCKGFARKEIVQ
jgi:sugar/nucleoside kinase (ribokinase family)